MSRSQPNQAELINFFEEGCQHYAPALPEGPDSEQAQVRMFRRLAVCCHCVPLHWTACWVASHDQMRKDERKLEGGTRDRRASKQTGWACGKRLCLQSACGQALALM